MDFRVRVIHPSIVTRGEELATCPHPPDDLYHRSVQGVSFVVCGWCGGHAMVPRG